MSARAEACRIAKEMAEKNGGKPSDYMSEAWRIVKESMEAPQYTDDPDDYDSRSYRPRNSGLLGRFASRAWENMKKGAQRTVTQDLNMMKAPKDSPKDVFGGFMGMLTEKPKGLDGLEIPQKVKDEVKRMFKFW